MFVSNWSLYLQRAFPKVCQRWAEGEEVDGSVLSEAAGQAETGYPLVMY